MIAPVYRYRAYSERVVDGDTYQLRVDLGFRVALSIYGRLRGVDTPEMSTSEGKAAKAYLETLLLPENAQPTSLVVETYKDRMSFSRWIVDVWLPNGESLAQHLISSGIGKEVS